MAKAAIWPNTDAEVRKHGEQTGLDTLVVHAVLTFEPLYDDLITISLWGWHLGIIPKRLTRALVINWGDGYSERDNFDDYISNYVVSLTKNKYTYRHVYTDQGLLQLMTTGVTVTATEYYTIYGQPGSFTNVWTFHFNATQPNSNNPLYHKYGIWYTDCGDSPWTGNCSLCKWSGNYGTAWHANMARNTLYDMAMSIGADLITSLLIGTPLRVLLDWWLGDDWNEIDASARYFAWSSNWSYWNGNYTSVS